MPYITYEETNFHDSSLRMIEQADDILREYDEQGYTMTLRQLYYQFVARGLLGNSQRNYKRLGQRVTDGRMAGMIDWNHLTDHQREFTPRGENGYEDPEELVRNLRGSYFRARWEGQPTYVEVWVEKEALADVIERAAGPWRVGTLACKGYMSASEMWTSAQRMAEQVEEGRNVVLLHLGDHDPSGIDMTRDIHERLVDLSRNHPDGLLYPDVFEVRRIALTMAQIDEYDPPPNPTKLTDSRAPDYVERYGYESWELDALPPDVLVDLVAEHVEPLIDWRQWNATRDRQAQEARIIDGITDHWDDVRELIEGRI